MRLLEVLLLIPTLALSLVIIVPLTGVLVRFRANYNPKALRLDPEGGAQAHTGPVIHSYFGMMARVYKLEGWAGLYKGLMPTLLSTVIVTLFILIFLDAPRTRHGAYRPPEAGILGTLAYSVGMMLISLPTAILTYRSITTPHKLPYLRLMHSLRILLTPTERRRPWILYLTPGLLPAEVLHIAIVVLGLGPLRRLLVPELSAKSEKGIADISIAKFSTYLIIVILSSAVLTPLEVIATRLAIQRNHASAEYNSVSQEVEGDAEETVEYSGAEEDVIGLRNEADPYLGLVDCAKRIINEEGWMSLYRACADTVVSVMDTVIWTDPALFRIWLQEAHALTNSRDQDPDRCQAVSDRRNMSNSVFGFRGTRYISLNLGYVQGPFSQSTICWSTFKNLWQSCETPDTAWGG
ncbi:putative mitochondrial carrier (TC 2.A.29) family protein [Lyophyllum shimeji]|uniref:Mitochondrial carrier (TC 2.A.29) family protein n=1 Tax=Lyophyllum shimeji TaxID=47721 RepID=A0A9P3UJY6_LYOSH|nr:putative mitochondrial carrier (TC 2.A.29) family protein [Lyophyllum shimeji]